jgi:hypothetical protein
MAHVFPFQAKELPMEALTIDELRRLAQQSQDPSVSIFLPTHRAGRETQQDPIRLRNLLRTAELQLQEREMRTPEITALLQPAQALLEGGVFWQHQQDGLALFLAASDFHIYQLPYSVDEQVVVDSTYYFTPVLPYFTSNGRYYILAVSQDDVRLFEGTRHSVKQMELPQGTPRSLEEALQFDDPEKQLQFHTGTAQGGMRAGIFHGQGAANDEAQKERIERYLNLVDANLKPWYNNLQAPLVLAGVDYLLPIFRRVSEYANIVPEGVTGNPERMRADELQAQAWPLVQPYFEQELAAVVEQYGQLVNMGWATHDLKEAVAAAYFGRVDKMIVAVDEQVWGKFDPATGKVEQQAGDQKSDGDIALLDAAAMQTLLNGGSVYGLLRAEMPVDAPAVAVLRY